MKNYDKEKLYAVRRLRLKGYSMSVPELAKDGGYACRKIDYEIINFGGVDYRCAKDHVTQVIYIDTHTVEEALESSS